MKKKNIYAVCLFMLVIILTGCSSRNKSDESGSSDAAVSDGGTYKEAAGDYDEDSYEAADNKADMQKTESAYEADQNAGRKEIKNISLTVETTEFEELTEKLENKIEQLKGYVEQSNFEGLQSEENAGNRYAGMTIRIPHEQLKSFTDYLKEETTITYRTEVTQDVTLDYVDKESKATALKTQEERILELIKAAENIEELIKLESRLSEIRYEREYVESSLKSMENQITYSTVYLDIREVGRTIENKKATIGGEIQYRFLESVDAVKAVARAFVIGIIGNIIYIAVLAAIACIVVGIVRRKKRKKIKEQ